MVIVIIKIRASKSNINANFVSEDTIIGRGPMKIIPPLFFSILFNSTSFVYSIPNLEKMDRKYSRKEMNIKITPNIEKIPVP